MVGIWYLTIDHSIITAQQDDRLNMSIQLAFSTVACPDWTMEQVVQRALEMGYQGVELRTLGPGGISGGAGESVGLACDPALIDPCKAGDLFKTHGVEPVCLSTSISLHTAHESAATTAHWQVCREIETASQIGCRFVRVFAGKVDPGQNLQTVIRRVAKRTVPLADLAAERGVQLLFENAGSLATAKPWWWLLDVIDHPSVGLCWNVANAAAAGEPTSVSLPTLNHRIRMVKVKDVRLGEGSGYVPLGDGTVGIEQAVQRFMGLGYGGMISVEWDRLWLPSLTSADEYLPQAKERLTAWIDAVIEAVEKGKTAAAKAASKNAPKPRPKAESKPETVATS